MVFAQNSFEKKIYFLEDTTLSLSVEGAIRLQKEGRFQPFNDDSKYISAKKVYYWCYIKIQNHAKQNEVAIDLGNSHIDKIELFQVVDNKVLSIGKTGDTFPYNYRPITSRNFVFIQKFQPNESGEYFLSINHLNSPMWMPLRIVEKEKFLEKEQNTIIIFGLFFGFLMMMILMNLFNYFTQKDPTYLVYSLYVIIEVLFFIADFGIGYQYFWGNNPMLENYCRPTLGTVGAILKIIMMRLFIQQNKTSKFYKPINYLLYCMTLSVFVCVYGFFASDFALKFKAIYIPAMQIIYILGVFLVFASLIESFRKGNRAALYYLFSLQPFLVWLIFESLSKFFGIGHTNFILPPLAISFFAEIIILAFGLSLRFSLFKKESEAFQQKLNQRKVETAHEVLTAQEDERQRIAKDLHDDIGGTLGVLKGLFSSQQVTGSERYNQWISLLDKATNDLRNISHDLMPSDFERFGLIKSIENQIDKINQAKQIQFEFLVSGEIKTQNLEHELTIYRIANELINNVLKHAKATEASLQLLYMPENLHLILEDNGVGYHSNQQESHGIGIKNLYSRAKYIDAKINIDSSARGTTFIIEIPYKKL